jgi:hypothetical protein
MRFTSLFLRRRAVLLGTSALLLSAPATLLAQEPTVLDPILIEDTAHATDTQIVSDDPADTGTTILGDTSISTRSDTSGDVNSVLRTVPTVQYANDASTDAGVNETDELTLLPLEVSIAGGRITDNNFMLNGIGINSILGSDAGYGNSFSDLSRDTGVLTVSSHYGLSSQSQYIPSPLVGSVEVMDSNVSAEYGGFLGGAVNAELRQPSTKENFGFVELTYSGSSLSEYEIGTEDGENPDDIEKPEFEKYSLTAEQNWAINDRTAAIFGFSTQVATASEDRDAQYLDRRTDNETTSNFYRMGLSHELLTGEKLSFEIDYTDYDQQYKVTNADNHGVTVDNSGLILNAKYENSWDALDFLGLETRNTKLEFNATYQHNKSLNDMTSDEYYVWYASYDTYDYVTDAFSDWCVAGDNERASCTTGAYGDKQFKDEQFTANVKLSGDIWNGTFAMGATVRHSISRHTGTGFDWYVGSEYNTEHGVDSFTCPANDPACIDSQYLRYWYHQNGFDVTVEANKFESFLELDQKFGDFRLRAGLRADYNDYLENFDISPRLALSWKPNDRFSATFGANRYYDDAYLTYAIMDEMPRYPMYSRSDDNGVVEDFSLLRNFEGYNYDQAGVKTPYKDELTLGLNYLDPWTEGEWRFKVIHRRGYNEFARSEESSTFENILTNDGRSGYDSVALEYAKNWDMSQSPRIDKLGLYLSTIWADRWETPGTAYGSDGVASVFSYYKDKSYFGDEFQEVTGNLDIPLRATLELNGAMLNEKLRLGLGADVVFSYWGVISEEEDTRNNPTYGNVTHDIYEDHKFSTSVMGYLTAEAQIAEIKGNPLTVKVKLDNIFGNVGNATADDDNPWVRTRSLALSMGYEW